jgi:hypothetical protein
LPRGWEKIQPRHPYLENTLPDTFDPFQTSELYLLHRPRWQLELDVSEFTLDVVRGGAYLDRFSDAEHEADYAYRLSMACPLDMCRDGVRIRVDNLWRTAPQRIVREGPHAELMRRLIADADGEGTPLDEFMRQACWDMYVTGTDIVTQMSAADAASVHTRADEQAAGLRPYFLRFGPLQRPQWAVTGGGHFQWARYCLGAEPAADEFGDAAPPAVRFLTVAADQWRLWSASSNQGGPRRVQRLSQGDNPLGRPPIVKLYFSESRKAGCGGVPLSLLTRPALVARVAMNLKSQADADLLAAVTRWTLSGADNGELPNCYAPGVIWKLANPDARLQIAQGDVAHIAEKRQWLLLYLAEILRLLKFRGGMAEIDASAGSGLRLALERTDLDNELRATAGQLEATELEMMRQAVSLATGVAIAPEAAAAELGYQVTYNRDYVLSPVGEMLDNIGRWLGNCGAVAGDVKEISREMTRQLANLLMRDGSDAYRITMEQIDGAQL